MKQKMIKTSVAVANSSPVTTVKQISTSTSISQTANNTVTLMGSSHSVAPVTLMTVGFSGKDGLQGPPGPPGETTVIIDEALVIDGGNF